MIVDFERLVDGSIFESLGLRFMLVGRDGDIAYLTTNPSGIDEERPGIVCRQVIPVSIESINRHEINELNSWDDASGDEEGDSEELGSTEQTDLRQLVGKILLDLNDGSQYVVIAYKETESLGPVVFLPSEGWKTRDQIEEDYAIGVEAEPCHTH